LRKAICAALLGGAMLAVAAPAANAADFWDRPSQDYGNQNVGTTSDPLQYVLTATCDANSGPFVFACTSPPNGVHSYGPITTTGPFTIDPATDACNGSGGTLVTPTASQPVAQCTLQITFKPTSGGVKTGTLSTTSAPVTPTNPTGGPLTVALKGTGILTGNGTGTTKKKCKKKGKKRSASAAKKKCKKKRK
jgi:hypothetical protein